MEDARDLLLDDDREYLDRLGEKYTVTRVDAPDNRYELQIVLEEYELPPKYTPTQVRLLVRQLPGYPEVGMDMFWTSPTVFLAGTTQRPDRADVYKDNPGRQWQRWSRHGTWRAGIDCLETFLAAVRTELKR